MSSVRTYEATLLIKPEVSEEGISKLKEQVGQWVTRHEGKVLESNSAGKKRLSYPLKKASEATYLEMKLALPPGEVTALTQATDLWEEVLRLFIVRKESNDGKAE